MGEKTRAFEDRFLSKIGKIDRRDIRDYLAQLLSRKQFLETIFDHLNEGIIVTDPELSIIYSNRMARQMLNWPKRRRFLGENLAERCPEGPLREILENMARRPSV